MLKIYTYFALSYKLLMKVILSEKNIVVVLFVLVLITFSMAQEDTRKMEKIYSGTTTAGTTPFLAQHSSSSADNNLIRLPGAE